MKAVTSARIAHSALESHRAAMGVKSRACRRFCALRRRASAGLTGERLGMRGVMGLGSKKQAGRDQNAAEPACLGGLPDDTTPAIDTPIVSLPVSAPPGCEFR